MVEDKVFREGHYTVRDAGGGFASCSSVIEVALCRRRHYRDDARRIDGSDLLRKQRRIEHAGRFR